MKPVRSITAVLAGAVLVSGLALSAHATPAEVVFARVESSPVGYVGCLESADPAVEYFACLAAWRMDGGVRVIFIGPGRPAPGGVTTWLPYVEDMVVPARSLSVVVGVAQAPAVRLEAVLPRTGEVKVLIETDWGLGDIGHDSVVLCPANAALGLEICKTLVGDNVLRDPVHENGIFFGVSGLRITGSVGGRSVRAASGADNRADLYWIDSVSGLIHAAVVTEDSSLL
ncbi:MAG: hypothetical protein HY775_08480 [Acidobacteria bacterium]|nr:hypothetical protein [Acidobacteriota bacterium]